MSMWISEAESFLCAISITSSQFANIQRLSGVGILVSAFMKNKSFQMNLIPSVTE